MSLFYVLTHNFNLWPDAYECPANFTMPDVRWPRFGAYLIVSGTAFLTLYLLCFLAILKVKSSAPSYQLMLIISIFDILSLFIGSIIAGYLTYNGIFYCQHPMFFYISGDLALLTWLTNCIGCIFLAIDRCSEVDPQFFLRFLVGKTCFKFVKYGLIFYAGLAFLFGKPAIFSSVYCSYIFDPMIGKDPTLYANAWSAYSNIVTAISTTTLNFYLCYYLIFQYGYSTSMWLYRTKRQIIMQGLIMCLLHSACALIYNYMQLFTPPLWLIIAGEVSWQLASGCLSIVYLTLNRTIRNTVVKMLLPRAIRAKYGWHIGVEEHLALERRNAVVGSLVKFNTFW